MARGQDWVQFLECVHADVDVTAVLFVLVAHPVLKGSVRYVGSGANALRSFTTLRVPHQDGDAIGGLNARAMPEISAREEEDDK